MPSNDTLREFYKEDNESCPYLDTITRTALDFDFEHSCSVTLQTGPHIYGCLVCGQFFRGRGRQTPAYTHSVDEGHQVFVHLSRGTFHCLPDDYEIRDPSLADISAALKPTFLDSEIRELDKREGLARDLFGRRYLPGFVGLNNLSKTDFINATVQALAHVRPLRDFFLKCGSGDPFDVQLYLDKTKREKNPKKIKENRKRKRNGNGNNGVDATKEASTALINVTVRPQEFSHLAQCFGELIRKIWSEKRFKSTVDPHMFIQAVSVSSKARFTIGKQAEAGEFISWLLHQLHLGIGGTRKAGSSIIHKIFQGTVQITTRKQKITNLANSTANNDDEDDRLGSEDEEEVQKMQEAPSLEDKIEEITTDSKFLQLTLDIPEKPLFKDDDGGLVIPQEPLVSVLKKFDGTTFNDVLKGKISSSTNGDNNGPVKRRYQLKIMPDYLILHLARFKRNNFYNEKNPTIVAFPVKNLDLSDYVFPENQNLSEKSIRSMSVKELKALLVEHGHPEMAKNIIEKSDLTELCVDLFSKKFSNFLSNKFNLIANITHNIPAEVGREGQHDPLEEGSYRCHVQHQASGQWYEMQDLHVQETMPQLIGVSESYVLIFERKGLK
eukprot:CAMPEP_0184864630 /NCGR_PEP_ID=MMETSP0580-20130426/15678_1 /TAXON_ID=1118495 /ORGANISM="Dactyliosolen fragilissimus" /LENGTH=609 /DNA_ID=CAMNT_0027363511 /DNA_START=93 /DNA_END=1922 /DNA_ORIENTATION=+